MYTVRKVTANINKNHRHLVTLEYFKPVNLMFIRSNIVLSHFNSTNNTMICFSYRPRLGPLSLCFPFLP